MSYCVVVSTTSNIDEAKKIAHGLVNNKLAACVNIIPGVTSVYFWKADCEQRLEDGGGETTSGTPFMASNQANEVCEDSELVLFIKTQKNLFDKVKNFIVENHSYELPEVIMLPIENGLEGYLNWVKENTL